MPKELGLRFRQSSSKNLISCPYPFLSPAWMTSEQDEQSIIQTNDISQEEFIGLQQRTNETESLDLNNSVPQMSTHIQQQQQQQQETSTTTNLIVNYLPSSMTQDDIKTLFSNVGELDSCKLVRDKTSGQSLGYAFVKYKRALEAEKAIKSFNGLRIQNKTIKVSLARPSSDRIKGANLYISGISKNMTSLDLHNLFAPFGDIITARVLCDAHTGLSKGVGFIRYNLKSQAERAIKEMNGSVLDGHKDPISVKFANQPTMNTLVNTPLVILPSQLSSNICPPQAGQIIGSLTQVASVNALRFPSQDVGVPSVPISGWTLFVYNLPPDVDESVLWRLFGPFGAVQGVRIMREATTQKCKGYGFVTMTNYDEAVLAASAVSGQNLDNHVIQVSFKNWELPAGGIVAPMVHTVYPTGFGVPGLATYSSLAGSTFGNNAISNHAGFQQNFSMAGFQTIPTVALANPHMNSMLTSLPIM